MFPECPNGAGGEGTLLSVSETNNPMYDMTGRDVADWMVKTTDRLENRFFIFVVNGFCYPWSTNAMHGRTNEKNLLKKILQLF